MRWLDLKNRLHICVYAVLAVMLCGCALMCVFWLPGALDYIAEFLGSYRPLYIICAIIGIPFFSVLLAAFAFPKAIADDTVFTAKTAKLINIISITLFFDCLILCVSSAWLLCAGESLLSPVLIFVALIGMTIALMLFILSRYVDRAAILKEEADSTL